MRKSLSPRLDRLERRMRERSAACPHTGARLWTERFRAYRPEYARFLESLKHRPESWNEDHVGQTALNLCGVSGIEWDGTKVTEPHNLTPEQKMARERCDKLLAMMSEYQRATLDLFPLASWGLVPNDLEGSQFSRWS